MSTDFLAGLSQALLNKAASSIYPAIKSKLGGTSKLSSPAVTVTWGVAKAPTFALGAAASTSFQVNLVLSLAITPDGGKKTSESVNAVATTVASINGGKLGLDVSDIKFSTSDKFVLAVLNAKKADIVQQVDDLLSKIEIPIGPVEGVTFGGHGVGVLGGSLYAAGGLSSPVPISPKLSPGSGFQVMMSEALIQQVVRSQWWDKTPKSFSASGATIYLHGYKASVSKGKLTLKLDMNGKYKKGAARWGVSISTVTATMDLKIKKGDELWLDNGSVKKPKIRMKPLNFLAGFETGITAGIILAVMNTIFENKLPGEIESRLNQKVFTVPTLSENFEGVNISVNPTGISIKGSGSSLLLSGNANFSAG